MTPRLLFCRRRRYRRRPRACRRRRRCPRRRWKGTLRRRLLSLLRRLLRRRHHSRRQRCLPPRRRRYLRHLLEATLLRLQVGQRHPLCPLRVPIFHPAHLPLLPRRCLRSLSEASCHRILFCPPRRLFLRFRRLRPRLRFRQSPSKDIRRRRRRSPRRQPHPRPYHGHLPFSLHRRRRPSRRCRLTATRRRRLHALHIQSRRRQAPLCHRHHLLRLRRLCLRFPS